MSAGPIDLALLRAIREELAERILPLLDGADRYTGAMMKRGLDVLIAQAISTSSPEDALLEAGYGTPETLAALLRSDTAEVGAELASALRLYVERKLVLSNPAFLTATTNGSEGARS
ncbi:hypothetical protein [Roseovarius pacificus]|uniref:hypothetical protein n=1 Tax=Roseovarius pacificus TaxID=337701 RepID=UPI002A18BB16|nr:hypothetical protein [Roseovarius pacificus]